MRWKWLTPQEKWQADVMRKAQWHRKFALWPRYDMHSRTAYWLEYVWVRLLDRNGMAPWLYEYRGGRDCPEVKLPPGGTRDAAIQS